MKNDDQNLLEIIYKIVFLTQEQAQSLLDKEYPGYKVVVRKLISKTQCWLLNPAGNIVYRYRT